MEENSKFFSVSQLEGTTEIVLGSADFVSRPIIVLAQNELIDFIDAEKPSKVVINFKHVSHISSEFLTAMLRIYDHVVGQDGELKLSHMNDSVISPFKMTNLAGSPFMIYETTPQAIDAF